MKTKTALQKKQSKSLHNFSGKEIKNPETITGGIKGPIDKDKLKRPTAR